MDSDAGDTKNQRYALVLPVMLFFVAAISVPIGLLTGCWVLFGMATACLIDDTDSTKGGDCTLCVDCNMDGTPMSEKDAQLIGLFCRYDFADNATTPLSGCTVGSAVLVSLTSPAIVVCSIAVVLVVLIATSSIVEACKAAGSGDKSAESSAEMAVVDAGVAVEAAAEAAASAAAAAGETGVKQAKKRCCRCCARRKSEAEVEAEDGAASAHAKPQRKRSTIFLSGSKQVVHDAHLAVDHASLHVVMTVAGDLHHKGLRNAVV
jgi:hypothetical protein